MLRLLRLIIFVPALFLMCCKSNKTQNKVGIDPHWKKVPDEWITRAKEFKYGKRDTLLLSGFAQIIKPDTLDNPHAEHVNPDYGFLFNLLNVDLDGDRQNEIICMLGWDVSSPALCVFKYVDSNWYLIYKEEVDTFYDSPTLYVANNYSPNKVFYFRHVLNHGSNIYLDNYTFYKLVGNKVFKCLDIVNNAHIDGWGLFINQEVKSTFEFRGDLTDELLVTYTYNFFPGSIEKSDCPWCSHSDVPLIKGEDYVNYEYNTKEHAYKLSIEKYKNAVEDLTAEKIACFGDFGNDSLFVKAFKRQIDTTLKMGTPLQKKILGKYLLLANKNKTVTTQEMEVKTQAGGTTFYGPKSKKGKSE